MTAWRLVRSAHAAVAFTGEGARLFGGRWNSVGTAVVYTSDSLALAALETLVHINPRIPMRYVSFRLTFDEALVEVIDEPPPGWQAEPPGPATMRIGDRWAAERRSAVLSIPSIVVPEQRNFLLNPAHPDFAGIRLGKPSPFAFDPRLIER